MRRTICCRRAAVAGAVVLLAVLAAGEAAAQPEPTVGMCSDFRVSPDTATFLPRGGEGSFSVHWTWTSPPTPTDALCPCVHAGGVRDDRPSLLDGHLDHAPGAGGEHAVVSGAAESRRGARRQSDRRGRDVHRQSRHSMCGAAAGVARQPGLHQRGRLEVGDAEWRAELQLSGVEGPERQLDPAGVSFPGPGERDGNGGGGSEHRPRAIGHGDHRQSHRQYRSGCRNVRVVTGFVEPVPQNLALRRRELRCNGQQRSVGLLVDSGRLDE